jgi:hypothetical protein
MTKASCETVDVQIAYHIIFEHAFIVNICYRTFEIIRMQLYFDVKLHLNLHCVSHKPGPLSKHPLTQFASQAKIWQSNQTSRVHCTTKCNLRLSLCAAIIYDGGLGTSKDFNNWWIIYIKLALGHDYSGPVKITRNSVTSSCKAFCRHWCKIDKMHSVTWEERRGWRICNHWLSISKHPRSKCDSFRQ